MNYVKLAGAGIIVASSCYTGIDASRRIRRMAGQLRQLRSALEVMDCEIRYVNTPLQRLCGKLSQACTGEVRRFFSLLADQSLQPDFSPVGVTRPAAKKAKLHLPPRTLRALEDLMNGFGQYDVQGQLRLVALAAKQVELESEELQKNLDGRCRMYELLGACTGIALMILVI